MARGTTKVTQERVEMLRSMHPHALGPLMGVLCVHFNLTAGDISKLVNAHEQTVFRWFSGSAIQPRWGLAVAKVVCILDWMYAEKIPPLTGNSEARLTALGRHVAAYRELAKAG